MKRWLSLAILFCVTFTVLIGAIHAAASMFPRERDTCLSITNEESQDGRVTMFDLLAGTRVTARPFPRSKDSILWFVLSSDHYAALWYGGWYTHEGVSLYIRKPGSIRSTYIQSGFQGGHGSWSPDQTRLAYTAGEGSGYSVYSVNIVNAQTLERQVVDTVSDYPALYPGWSLQGDFLAFQQSAQGRPTLVIWSVAEAKIVRTIFFDTLPSTAIWLPDNRIVYLQADDSSHFRMGTISAVSPNADQHSESPVYLYSDLYLNYAAAQPSADGQYVSVPEVAGNNVYILGMDSYAVLNTAGQFAWIGNTAVFLRENGDTLDWSTFTPDGHGGGEYRILYSNPHTAYQLATVQFPFDQRFAVNGNRIAFLWVGETSQVHLGLIDVDGKNKVLLPLDASFATSLDWIDGYLTMSIAPDNGTDDNRFIWISTDGHVQREVSKDFTSPSLIWWLLNTASKQRNAFLERIDLSKPSPPMGSSTYGDLYLVNLDSAATQPVITGNSGGVENVLWSPDFSRFAVAYGNRLYVFDAEGRQLAQFDNVRFGFATEEMRWEPCS